MTSSFFGLNIALSALQAQQTALNITAHNVANANTDGYTRQDAQMVAADPFPVPIASIAGQAGQIGTGVNISMIRRLRDSFLDLQVRTQMAGQGYWNVQQDYLEQIETVFNEPSDQGLNSLLTKFWGAWQDLATNPESYAARVAVLQSGTVLAGVLQRDYQQLAGLRTQADQEIVSKTSQINDWLAEIASLNRQISAVEVRQASSYDPNAQVAKAQANDLRDRRDLLLDQLSKAVKVSYREESDSTVTVWLGDISSSDPKVQQILVQADSHNYLLRGLDSGSSGGKVVWSSDSVVDGRDSVVTLADGELRALQDLRDDTLNAGSTDSVANRLDQLAKSIIMAVNNVHATGYGLDGSTGLAFFMGTGAADIAVSSGLISDPNKVAAASAAGRPGDGSKASEIAEALQSTQRTINGRTATLSDWYRAMISQLGIDSQRAQDMSTNQGLLVDRLTRNRESFSGVSLDEEAANVVRFQRAFEAAARVMSAMDEMLDKLVNGVGIVGR